MQVAVASRAGIASSRVAESRKTGTSMIVARIAMHARSEPSRLAIVDASGNRLTYGELDRRANQLAAYLVELGAGPDRCVGLLLERSADFIVAALGVVKAGAAYLPLDTSTPADRVAFVLADAGAPLLISHQNKAHGIAAGACRIVDLDGESAASIASASSDAPEIELTSDALAYVIYTSGSTGRPKGVEITHGNLINLVDWHNAAFDVKSPDRASQVAGLGFDAAGWEIWPYLSAGASLYIADEMTRRSPQALRDWIVSQRITISFVPTVLAEQLLHQSWPAETALRRLLTGADTLHRRPSSSLPFVLVNNYGPTECTVVATSGIVAPDAGAHPTGGVTSGDPVFEGQPSIGRAISNTTTYILNDALQAVAPGEPGELCLTGAHVGRGYRNNPEMTASKFVMFTPPSGAPVRIYRTGDRARQLENGEIAFLGRLDDQVKIRGYRIELGEIVSWLDRVPGIEASAVVAREGDSGPELVAYIVAAKEAKLASPDLRELLASRLPEYMVPAKFVSIASLPMTPNGKLDRAALPAPTAENLLPGGKSAEAEAPATDAGATAVESKISGMVAALLEQPSVARDDNFFMLGGHSMLGVQLVARIRDTFGVKLTLRQLFGAPTVMALSTEVNRLMASPAAARA